MIKLEDLKKINREVVKVATSLKVSAQDVLKEKSFTFLSDDAVAKRLDTCHKCPFYQDGRCQACGCVLLVKSKIAEFRCPTGQWSEKLPEKWDINIEEISIIPKAFHNDGKFVYAYSKDSQGVIKYITNLETHQMEVVRI